MHFHTLVSFLLALFLLTSCANEGVIVRKDAGPLPFYESLGVDGSYAFLLRDNAGSVHRQLVTPEVFERYAVGQYFNDLQPVGTPASNFKEVRTASTPVVRNPSSWPLLRSHTKREEQRAPGKRRIRGILWQRPTSPGRRSRSGRPRIRGRKPPALRKRTPRKRDRAGRCCWRPPIAIARLSCARFWHRRAVSVAARTLLTPGGNV